ncbi:MAG: tRNA (adenosine(37)-N6)-threonylcarbamoyltransferase complex transferase subunit TsaD [Pseudomonadota bacterium]|jgi:N6-L-threonylcarbamoyladenine synthase|nr:tRNA (adenosine(37)-N6)-threonylcarbamoyltransferase complex transferase subunit TsaD [Pseudomonadota bacterium]
MRVLGIETSCDETGVALYDTEAGLLGQALHSQVAMHERYGGVVPELASRDHIRRLPRLVRQVCDEAGVPLASVDAIAYTAGPGLAGALLVGAAFGCAAAFALGRPAIGVHHLEGHLLSPLLADDPPAFPFVALLCSGGHTQLMHVEAVGRYRLLGDTLDDAAGEAFDKSAKLMGLGYPGGPAISRLAESGRPGVFRLPRPMLRSDDADFSFSGLKTAVLNQVRRAGPDGLDDQARADLAREIEEAITEVLATKAADAVEVSGTGRLVIAGGVSANRRLRERLAVRAAAGSFEIHFPPLALCTDNGAMIAFAGALRLAAGEGAIPAGFEVRPRWPLASLDAPG